MKTALTMLSRISLMGTLLAVQASPTAQAADAWQDSFSRNEFQSGGATLRYRLCAAAESTSGTKPPLVLYLHGAGERGDDNAAQLKHGVVEFHRRQATHPCVVLAPQCPAGRKWVEVDWGDSSGSATFPSEPSEPLRLAIAVMDGLIAAGRVDPDRLYVTGLSMGGYGTWYAAGMPGSRFAAAAPICGGGDPAWAKRYLGLPLWAFHGDDDRAVPVGRSREMIAAVRAAGGEPKYTEYPAVGHDCWTRTYADDAFHEWLFAQRRPTP
jgi:predicted peptidase